MKRDRAWGGTGGRACDLGLRPFSGLRELCPTLGPLGPFADKSLALPGLAPAPIPTVAWTTRGKG